MVSLPSLLWSCLPKIVNQFCDQSLFTKFDYQICLPWEIIAVTVATHGVGPAAVVPLLVVRLAVVVPDVVVVYPAGFATGSVDGESVWKKDYLWTCLWNLWTTYWSKNLAWFKGRIHKGLSINDVTQFLTFLDIPFPHRHAFLLLRPWYCCPKFSFNDRDVIYGRPLS